MGLLSLTPAEAQEAPTALEAMETRNLPAVPAMEAQEVPAMQVAEQVARKKEMKTPRRLSKRRKNIGHLCTMPEGRPLESDAQKTAECRRCIESNGAWKQCLTPNGHGCAACKEVIEAGAWNKRMIRNHHDLNRDLVCPKCAERGYAPGKYDEHQCDECLEKFGSLKFDRKSKYNKKRNAKYRLVCKACQTKIRSTLQCSSCMGAYELTYWSKSERRNHKSPKHTNLVCKACRLTERVSITRREMQSIDWCAKHVRRRSDRHSDAAHVWGHMS